MKDTSVNISTCTYSPNNTDLTGTKQVFSLGEFNTNIKEISNGDS